MFLYQIMYWNDPTLKAKQGWKEIESNLCDKMVNITSPQDVNKCISLVTQFENSNAPLKAKIETLESLLCLLLNDSSKEPLMRKVWQAYCYQTQYALTLIPDRLWIFEEHLSDWIKRIGNQKSNASRILMNDARFIFASNGITKKLSQVCEEALGSGGFVNENKNPLERYLDGVKLTVRLGFLISENRLGEGMSITNSRKIDDKIVMNLQDFVRSEQGMESCCDFMQSRIDQLYAKWGVNKKYRMTTQEKNIVKDHLKDLDIYLNRGGVGGLSSWSFGGRVSISGPSSIDHELLHAISGVFYRQINGSFGLIETRNPTQLDLFLFYIKRDYTACPTIALEEGMTALLSSGYPEITDAINKRIMALEPNLRLIMADKLTRTYMNFATEDEIKVAEDFVQNAIEDYVKK